MKAKRLFILFAVLACLVVAFIFCQSILDRQESAAQSGIFAAFFQRLLDPHGRIDSEVFHGFIRKTAHFVEFFTLGLFTAAATINLGCIKGRRYVAAPMLLTLATAVADEYLQFFTGRGSQVTDVVLDYSGALTGLATAALLSYILTKMRQKRGMNHDA